ncbi:MULTISPECIES: hypothetical protein [Pseudomonas]|uniref:hypothetical protein n=1 Tax=Pseudomonas TaxID=286 RepID=UPI00235ED91E|nr:MULTISPECIES: hypothetical protein [Pseudomonas]WJV25586.1 hypothetical protein PSR66_05975 [Pseudomonas chlororaphis]
MEHNEPMSSGKAQRPRDERLQVEAILPDGTPSEIPDSGIVCTWPNGDSVLISKSFSPDEAGAESFDGGVICEWPNGVQVALSNSGEVSAQFWLRQVQIANLGNVVSHIIEQKLNMISHTVRFIGGGILEYTHLSDGSGLSLIGTRISLRYGVEGVVTVLGTLSDADLPSD